MSIRNMFGVTLAATLATSGLLLGAAPSQAVVTPGPWDTPNAASAVDGDLIGVGSDTSQEVVYDLAQAWNGQSPAPAYKVVTWGAAIQNGVPLTGCEDLTNAPQNCQIKVPVSGIVNRPNGSGQGKGRLWGANNDPHIDFARASSSLNTDETNAGLRQFPFARDVIGMVTSANVASHAPASLTIAQILDIYKGTVTDWSQVGGTAGTIVPMIPQSGSGTRSFFTDQLKAANGGVAVTLAGTVQEVQEHDDTPIKGNANAIAPFSLGRARLLGSTLRVEQGWTKERALYNVVRGTSLSDPKIQAVFGPNGFFCSDAATAKIIAKGFDQLDSEADGGVCGVATTAATTNFALNGPKAPIATTTTVTGSSPAPGKARIVARVTSKTTATGTVTFFEGTRALAKVPLIGGSAMANVALAPGTHGIRAVYTPTFGTVFIKSAGQGVVTVKAASKITESFPAKVKAGKRAKGTVTVSLIGTTAKATGKVIIKLGAKKLGAFKLVGGKATIKLPKLPKGKNRLTAIWKGNAIGLASKLKFKIVQK